MGNQGSAQQMRNTGLNASEFHMRSVRLHATDVHVANASGYDIQIYSYPDRSDFSPSCVGQQISTSIIIPSGESMMFRQSEAQQFITIYVDTRSVNGQWTMFTQNYKVPCGESIIVTKVNNCAFAIKFHKKGIQNVWVDEDYYDHLNGRPFHPFSPPFPPPFPPPPYYGQFY